MGLNVKNKCKCGRNKQTRSEECQSCANKANAARISSRKDKCKCGLWKDKRAKQCRACEDGVFALTKVCTVCRIEKPISEFRIRTRKISRPRPSCRKCEAAQARVYHQSKPIAIRKLTTRQWEKDNPEKVSIQKQKQKIKALGLGKELDFIFPLMQTIIDCEICGLPFQKGKKGKYAMHIDHNHSTGFFRGLLCGNCNLGLGFFGDNIKAMLKAIDYLKNRG